MDLFSREQQVYDASVAVLLSEKEDATTVDMSHYGKLVEEYGKLLNQFRQFRHSSMLSDLPTQYISTDNYETLGKAHYDVLTGIFNKRYLNETLDRTLATMCREGDALSMILVDVDYFSQYNDIYGQDAGDGCLHSIAEVLKSCLFRRHDFVARYGAEEFIAILPHTPEHGARLVADRMLESVRCLEIPHSGSEILDAVSVSIGIVSGSKNTGSWVSSDFFKRVDEALFQAKNNGRNQYACLGL